MNDVVINKIQSIQRCVARARAELAKAGPDFRNDFSRQDAAILNILRACEQAIDLANHIIKLEKLGIPTSSSQSFDLLAKKQIITVELAGKLGRMTRLRNRIIHEYQTSDISVIEQVVTTDLNDVVRFGEEIHRHMFGGGTINLTSKK